MKKKLLTIILFAAFLSLICPEKHDLVLNEEITLNINRFEKSQVDLQMKEIQESIKDRQNLYIKAYSPIHDPEQKPRLKLTAINSQNQNKQMDVQLCQNNAKNSASICIIPKQLISAKLKTIEIDVVCQQNDCQINIEAYLGSRQIIKVGDQISIKTQQTGTSKLFQIQLKQIQLIPRFQAIVKINNVHQLSSQISMYATYGSLSYLRPPSNFMYMKKDTIVLGNKIILDLTYQEMSKENTQQKAPYYIMILVDVGKKADIQFSTRLSDKKVTIMQINHEYDDYVQTDFHNYRLKLDNILPYSDKQQFELRIDCYQGNPELQIRLVDLNGKLKTVQHFNEFVIPHIKFQFERQQLQKYKELFIRVGTSVEASYKIHPILTRSHKFYQKIDLQISQDFQLQNKLKYFKFLAPLQTDSSDIKFLINIKPIQEVQLDLFQCVDQNDQYLYKQEEQCFIQQTNNTFRNHIKTIKHSSTIQFTLNNDRNCYKRAPQLQQIICPFYIAIRLQQQQKKHTILTLSHQKTTQVINTNRKYPSSLSKDQQINYIFNKITQQNYMKVFSVSFYLNCPIGGGYIFVSDQPSASKENHNLLKSDRNVVTIDQFQITGPTSYYIKIKAYQQSQCTLSTYIRYKYPSDDGQTLINLEQGVTMNYNLPRKLFYKNMQQQSLFTFTTRSKTKYNFIIMELEGVINYNIKKVNGEIICEKENIESSQCLIDSENSGDHYLLKIQEYQDRGYTQSVSIAVVQEGQCFTYFMSVPLYQHLYSNQKSCIQISTSITQNEDFIFKLVTSMSTIQQYLQNLQFQISIASTNQNRNYNVNFTDKMHTFNSTKIKSLCDFSEGDCQLTFKLILTTLGSEQDILLRLYKQSQPITLYDGIPHTQISSIQKKYYNYMVNDRYKSIYINLISASDSQYSIYVRIVDRNIYIPANSEMQLYNNKQSATWVTHSSKSNRYQTKIIISKQELSKYYNKYKIGQGRLLISVTSKGKVEYDIEIVQHQSMIFEGESKIGYLKGSEKVYYELYADEISYLQIQPLSCTQLSAKIQEQYGRQSTFIGLQTTLPTNQLQNINSPILLTIINSGYASQYCPFRINLQNIPSPQSPIPPALQIWQQYPHKIDLTYNQQTYFYFYHNRNTSLKIHHITHVGNSKLQISLKNTQQFKLWIKGEKQFQNSQKQIIVLNQQKNVYFSTFSENFCFDCYYVMKITADPQIKSEMIIHPIDSSLILKQKTEIQDGLSIEQAAQYSYQTGTLDQFYIILNILYGQLTIQVKNQNKSLLIKQTNQSSVQIAIDRQSMPLYFDNIDKLQNVLTEYTIIVSTTRKTACTYKIQINSEKDQIYARAGSTYQIQIDGYQTKNVVIQNSNLTHKAKVLFSGWSQNKLISATELQYQVKFKSATLINDIIINTIILKSIDKTTTSIYPRYDQQGIFTISIHNPTPHDLNISVTVLRQDLTQILQQNLYIFVEETILEIFIPEKHQAIINVFACQGNVFVRGSKKYSDLVEKWTDNKLRNDGDTQSQEQSLAHENIGGHYTLIVKQGGESGLYYIRVQNRQFNGHIKDKVQGIRYSLNYFLLPINQTQPYQQLNLPDNEIHLQKQKDGITITVQNLQILQNGPVLQDLRFIYTFSKNRQVAKKGAMCIEYNHTSIKNNIIYGKNMTNDTITYKINNQEIKAITQQISDNQWYVGVTLQAKLKYPSKILNHYSAVFIYDEDTIKMSKNKKGNKLEEGFGIFGWITIIFLFMGALILGYTLFVKALRYLRGYDDQSLQQETINELNDVTNVTKNSQDKPKQLAPPIPE